MKENILITPGYSMLNKGDSAIISGMVRLLEKCVPDSAVALVSMYGSSDLRFQESAFEDIETVGAVLPYPRAGSPGAAVGFAFHLARFLLLLAVASVSPEKAQHVLGRGSKKTYRAFLQSRMVAVKGGGFIYSFGMKGTISLFIWLHPLLLARALKKPVVLFPQSIGPLETAASRALARFALNRADLIMVREELSLETLEALGVSGPQIVVVPDAAFALEAPAGGMGQSILAREGIPEDAALVGVTVRPWNFLGSSNPDELFEKYLKTMAAAVEHVLEMGSLVVLVPQVTGPTDAENDLVPTKMLMDMVRDKKGRVTVIRGDYTPIELKALYGMMKLFIGTRMHSNIFALSMGVPAIAISYMGHKTHGIMDMLGVGEYVLDIDGMDEQKLIEKIDRALADGEALSAKLKERVRGLRDRLERDACLVKEFL